MTHPTFELTVDRGRLARWAGLNETEVPAERLHRTMYSHQHYPVLRIDTLGKRELTWMRQGLVPAYAHDEEGAETREEAHVESLTCVSCFRSAFRRRRCLIPADLLTELRHGSDLGSPACSFALNSGNIFSIAGVWETWENDQHHQIQSFAVITTLSRPA